MNRGILILASVFAIVFTSCNNNASEKVIQKNVAIAEVRDANTTNLPIMTFTKTEHDFGTINEGDIVAHEFKFTNTGNAPLVIINAKGSCGCTVSKWPKEPIAPREEAVLVATFNSKGKPNMQTKQITITANTEVGKETLQIKAIVTPKGK